ncbi:hypothetical protein FGIG_10569, partial [Fasciola gigantica]
FQSKAIALNDLLLDRSHDYSRPLYVHLSERLLNVVNSSTKRRLGKLDPYTMREYLMSKHVPPMSLLTALIFIEKFVSTESAPHMLEEMTAVELFTVSLILASKYLYDVDCDHGAYNSEWAVAFGMDLHELNNLEIRFLSALNWCCFVSCRDLETVFQSTEFGQPVLPLSPSEPRSKRFTRITRFRRNLRAHCDRQKNVASKMLAVLAATYVTYMNRNVHFGGPAPFNPNSYNSNLTGNSTYPSVSPFSVSSPGSLPRSVVSLVLREKPTINITSTRFSPSDCPKYSTGAPRVIIPAIPSSPTPQNIHLYPSAFVPNSLSPLICTVACEG